VAWDKPGGFIGRDALLRQRDSGVRRRLVALRLHDDDALMHHNEPIWRDGVIVGATTSGMYGHTIGAPLALGYVANPDGPADRDFLESGTYEVEVACERIPATLSLTPFYDPRSTRVRG
jgi:4-methylaminobutanoate oxidase (formaldehyde-forming)